MPAAAALENPPALPPDVTSQMGSNPYSGAIAQMGQEDAAKSAAAPGATHPQGAVIAQLDAIEKVLTQVLQQSPVAKPYISRMIALGQACKSELQSAPAGAQPQMSPQPQGASSNATPTEGHGSAGPFPG